MKFLPILIRFSLYGFCTFAAFGYLAQNSQVHGVPVSLKLILLLGLTGAVSVAVSTAAVIALREIYKELTSNG